MATIWISYDTVGGLIELWSYVLTKSLEPSKLNVTFDQHLTFMVIMFVVVLDHLMNRPK